MGPSRCCVTYRWKSREGELVALLGTNGNGKSTLLNAILGLVRPAAGSVRLEWDGKAVELAGRPAEQIVEQRHCAGARGAAPVSAFDGRGESRRSADRAAVRAITSATISNLSFSAFPVLRERRRQLAGTMSGGQQQLLAIARALMTVPRIVLIDEPSVGLAPIAVEQVLSTVQELRSQRGLTVLMAEQSIVQAIAIADRSLLLTHGRIVREFDREHAALSAEEIRAALLTGRTQPVAR